MMGWNYINVFEKDKCFLIRILTFIGNIRLRFAQIKCETRETKQA